MDKHKLIIIHGLNNSTQALSSLGSEMSSKFEVTYLKLPQHGQRPLSFDFKEACDLFVNDLSAQLTDHCSILSYSLGCAYLQYALENRLLCFDLKKIIYLSPALKTKMNLALFANLPPLLPVPSFSPLDLRLRHFCFLGQYQTMYELGRRLKLEEYPKIFADPLDELIDLRGLNFESVERDYLKWGEHHLTIHPRYFRGDEWIDFMKRLKSILSCRES